MRNIIKKLAGAVFPALLGSGSISVDSTWMAVIVTPGTGVNDDVAVLPSQVAPLEPASDHVRSGRGDWIRLLRRKIRPADVSEMGKPDRHAEDDKGTTGKRHLNRSRHNDEVKHVRPDLVSKWWRDALTDRRNYYNMYIEKTCDFPRVTNRKYPLKYTTRGWFGFLLIHLLLRK